MQYFLLLESDVLEGLHVLLATRTSVEEPLCRDKKRGEGSSCLWHGSDVLMCDPEANEQMLHYPHSALPGLQQHMDKEVTACKRHEGEDTDVFKIHSWACVVKTERENDLDHIYCDRLVCSIWTMPDSGTVIYISQPAHVQIKDDA